MPSFLNAAKNLVIKNLKLKVTAAFSPKIRAPPEPLNTAMLNAAKMAIQNDQSLKDRGAEHALLKSYPHSYDKGGEEWATTEYYEGGENGLFITTKHVKGDGTVKKD